MKTSTLSACLLAGLLPTVLVADPAAPSKPTAAELSRLRETERRGIQADYRKLVAARAEMQNLSETQEARKQHVAALQALLQRARKMDDSEATYSIHTELNHFGIVIPDMLRWKINDAETVEPKVLLDPKTRVTYYLESDGRHVTAINAEGKILWHRDPFNDAGLWPYRVSKPVIVDFAFAREAKQGIGVGFNSSQFGWLDPATGAFKFAGQD